MSFSTMMLQSRSARVLGVLVVGLTGGELVGQSLSKRNSLWAIQPLRKGNAPSHGHPVDAFLGRGAGPSADRRALIRRLSYGLTGLPPAPRLVEEFVADGRPDGEAFKAVVAEASELNLANLNLFHNSFSHDLSHDHFFYFFNSNFFNYFDGNFFLNNLNHFDFPDFRVTTSDYG